MEEDGGGETAVVVAVRRSAMEARQFASRWQFPWLLREEEVARRREEGGDVTEQWRHCCSGVVELRRVDGGRRHEEEELAPWLLRDLW